MWPRVDGEHIFHRGYEGGIGLRRDDPALPAMRLETVFLSVRPIVESLARSTIPSSTTLFSTLRRRPRHRPSTGCGPSTGASRDSFLCGAALAIARVPPHSAAPHTSLPQCPFQPCSPPSLEPRAEANHLILSN